MTVDHDDREVDSHPQAVYLLDDDGSGGDGGPSVEDCDRWVRDAAWVVATTDRPGAVPAIATEEDAGCVVADAPAVCEPEGRLVTDVELPVVAIAEADAEACEALERGVDEVYRTDGSSPDPELLAHRARTAVYTHLLDDDSGSDRRSGGPRNPAQDPALSPATEDRPGDRSPADDGSGAGEGADQSDPGDPRGPSERERRLERLIATTRRLMAAETTAEVMEVTSEMAAEVLEFPGTGIRRYDPETETLESVSLGATVSDIEERPPYDVEGTPHGRAFRRDATVVEDIGTDDPYDRDPFVQTMYVPIGDWGILSAGRTERPFDRADVRLAELLATTTEAALNRTERQETLVHYRAVLDAVAGMVFAMDESGEFTLVTGAFAEELGREESELVGTPVSSVLSTPAGEDGSNLYRAVLEADGETTTVEGECRPAAGTPFPVEVELSTLSGQGSPFRGAVGLVRDVSELRAARQQLAEERDRFTYLFDNLPDAVVEVEFLDSEPIVRSVNPAFERLFGYDADAVLGSSLDEFILATGEDDQASRLNERAGEGNELETTVKRETRSGTRHFLLRVVPYEETGEGTRSFAIYTDISEQKQREESLQVINRVLRHNLRNELNVIAGYGDRIATQSDSEELARAGAYVRDTARNLANLGEKGREIQWAIRAGFEERESVDLTDVAAEVVERFDEEHPDATVETDLPPSLTVESGARIRTAVRNLVENAVLHAGDAPSVRVIARRRDGWAELRVVDDGPGLPESERAVVTGRRDITQLEHASGLGLWLVKWIVEGYGGRIDFEDSDHGGTTAIVQLPAAD